MVTEVFIVNELIQPVVVDLHPFKGATINRATKKKYHNLLTAFDLSV